MNWKEIKEKYPKAWDKYENWDKITFFEDWRRLYDFFDEQGIYIWLMWDNHPLTQWWTAFISYNDADGDREQTSFDHWDIPNFKSRKKAEEQAFIKAFEILENVLTQES